jgi:hypothetical protein
LALELEQQYPDPADRLLALIKNKPHYPVAVYQAIMQPIFQNYIVERMDAVLDQFIRYGKPHAFLATRSIVEAQGSELHERYRFHGGWSRLVMDACRVQNDNVFTIAKYNYAISPDLAEQCLQLAMVNGVIPRSDEPWMALIEQAYNHKDDERLINYLQYLHSSTRSLMADQMSSRAVYDRRFDLVELLMRQAHAFPFRAKRSNIGRWRDLEVNDFQHLFELDPFLRDFDPVRREAKRFPDVYHAIYQGE